MKPPLVEVRWHDAYKRASSATAEDAAKDEEYSVRLTVGWLVEENDRVIRVAMTYDAAMPGEVAEYDDRYTIPRKYVDLVRYVERGPKRAKKPAAAKAE